MKFAKYDSATKTVAEYDGSPISVGKGAMVRMHPSPRDLALAGYHPMRTPEARRTVSEWNLERGMLVPVYAPRILSKLKVVVALTKMGKWADAKAWLEANGLYDLFVMAQDFREDNEYFTQGLAALKELLGVGDDETEQLLSQCVAD